MGRELHAIINPASGNGRTGKGWPRLREQVRSFGISIHEHPTTHAGHATHIARELLTAGASEIAVVGGDGTINETVNGLFDGNGRGPGDTVLSLIPCGTGHDFARSLGIFSIRNALDLLANGSEQAIDVARVQYRDGERYHHRIFLNVADVGLGAEAAALINRSSKVLGGFFSYLVGATRSILAFNARPARVIVDGKLVHDGPLSMVVLANGRYHAGGMLMAPMASLSDGQFEILVVREVPKLTLLGSILPGVYRGRHVGHPAILHVQGKDVSIQSDECLLFEMDGEQPGTTDINATILPKAIRVRAPLASEPPNSGRS